MKLEDYKKELLKDPEFAKEYYTGELREAVLILAKAIEDGRITGISQEILELLNK